MPPKKQEKVINPIFEDLKNNVWWEYKEYSKEEIELVEDFIKTNKKDLANLLTSPNIIENINALAKAIGVHVHPMIKETPSYLQKHIKGEELTDQQEEPDPEKEHKFLIFQNIRIDWITIRLIAEFWVEKKEFQALKFNRNNFSTEVANYLCNFINDANNHVQKIFFEWNPVDESIKENFFGKFGSSTTLQFVCLRQCQIDDAVIEILCKEMLSNSSCNIKYLEFYDNHITRIGIQHIANMIDVYTRLEYLGLSKNDITSYDDCKELFTKIGKFKLTEEQIKEHTNKEKERDELIKKAEKSKKKGIPQDIPRLDPLTVLPDGSTCIVKNSQMKMLNLSMNRIPDSDSEQFIKLIGQLQDEIQIVLTYNKWDNKTKDKLRRKLKQNVYV